MKTVSAKFQQASLWAAENRSIEDRLRGKVLGKIKVRVARKQCVVANVLSESEVEWVDDDRVIEEDVRQAVNDFIDELVL